MKDAFRLAPIPTPDPSPMRQWVGRSDSKLMLNGLKLGVNIVTQWHSGCQHPTRAPVPALAAPLPGDLEEASGFELAQCWSFIGE